ncbi:Ubiquitin-associated domain-containing protein 2 [Taenia crassiceps]|uniref:Ubiquitin-associated domain-containing protein 2 n=1 Tax=Taenia crassiceps TaxID=6207 RepID=A0ABR4QPS7_9CEST
MLNYLLFSNFRTTLWLQKISVIWVSLLSTAFEHLSIKLLSFFGVKPSTLPSGPLSISRKTFLYLIGLRLATSSPGSLIVCGCGLLTGLVYRWKNLQKVNLIPSEVAELFGRLFGPFLSSEAPDDVLKPIGATLELQRQEALDRQEQALMDFRRTQFVNNNRRRNYIPQPHEIQNLVDMGFLEERSQQALAVANGDIYEALNLLQDPSFDPH